MRAVDTNILVRLEAMWVLVSVYDLGPEKIATAVEMFLHHRDLTIQDSDVVAAALEAAHRLSSKP